MDWPSFALWKPAAGCGHYLHQCLCFSSRRCHGGFHRASCGRWGRWWLKGGVRHGWNVIYFKDFSPKNSGKIIPNTLSPNSHWFSGKWPKLVKWAPPILHFEGHNRTTFSHPLRSAVWTCFTQTMDESLSGNPSKKLYQQHLSQWFGFFHSPPAILFRHF